jgi:hypothetical protein
LKTKSGKKSKRCKYYFEEEQVEIVDINNPFEFYKLRALNVAAALQVQAEIEVAFNNEKKEKN